MLKKTLSTFRVIPALASLSWALREVNPKEEHLLRTNYPYQVSPLDFRE